MKRFGPQGAKKKHKNDETRRKTNILRKSLPKRSSFHPAKKLSEKSRELHVLAHVFFFHFPTWFFTWLIHLVILTPESFLFTRFFYFDTSIIQMIFTRFLFFPHDSFLLTWFIFHLIHSDIWLYDSFIFTGDFFFYTWLIHHHVIVLSWCFFLINCLHGSFMFM